MRKKILFAAVIPVFILGLVSSAAAESRFGFKLGGGLAYIGGGDINAGLKGYLDYIADMFEIVVPGDVEGGYAPFHFGPNFSGELLYQVTPKFALGLGAGFFTMSRESSFSLIYGSNSLTTMWEPAVSAVPVTLNFHYYASLSRSLKLVLTAGAGWYFARYDIEEMQGDVTVRTETTGGGFGAHGGFGFELELAPGFFLTLDILGRYARVGELGGLRDNHPGEEGKIWFFDADFDAFGIDDYSIVVWDSGIPSGEGFEMSNLRKARLGLSGFGAVFGILIRI